jgi:predicted acylesterase/phospholipase RssA
VETPLERLRQAKKIGFVFAGGAARCVFQIGVVDALAELGIEPALTVGVSAGAWNAALMSARLRTRMRAFWRAFARMPHLDLRNLLVEHSPWRYTEIHRRNFHRVIGRDRYREPDALPLFVSVTRLADRTNRIYDAREFDDPLDLLLATNFFFPFYTHAPLLHGHRCGDGGVTDNAPYEKAFAEGCDAVVLIAQKGESEGGLFKNAHDLDHVIPDAYRSHVVVIRPRHRMPIAFTEKSWPKLEPFVRVGYLRTREVLLGETHPETEIRARGEAPSAKLTRLVRRVRRARAIIGR